jgi:hypothetical protein
MKVWIPDDVRKMDLDRGLRSAGLRLDGTRRKDGCWNTIRTESAPRQTCEHDACAKPASATLGGVSLCSLHAVQRMRELHEARAEQRADWRNGLPA